MHDIAKLYILNNKEKLDRVTTSVYTRYIAIDYESVHVNVSNFIVLTIPNFVLLIHFDER